MDNETVAILGIGTAVPPYRLEQTETAERLAEALAEHKDAARWARRIFNYCGVKTRYTCEPNLLEKASNSRYFPSDASPHDVLSTAERMDVYRQQSIPLGYEAANKALSHSKISAAEITHLITVSCTGFFLPGMDVALIRKLGLRLDIHRIPLTFLGCSAGLMALRLSRQIMNADRTAKILIVCVELCTLHIQASHKREDLFAAAFFGDGAAACVVGTPTLGHRGGFFTLEDNRTIVFPDSVDEMMWTIGNYGFNLYLSPRIPKLLGEFVPTEIERLLGGEPLPSVWAIHPGGRGIIDTIQTMHRLTDEQTAASRAVLRRFGNVSSATILFVLDQLARDLVQTVREDQSGIALAFGPGLHAELMRITYFSRVSTVE